MNLNFNKYQEAWDDFARRCPAWAEEAIECVPRHNHILRVYLRNGDCVDYDNRGGTFRYITKDVIFKPDDITDEACREGFALNLNEIMQSRGITQAVLSKRTGITQGMISKYLRCASTPSLTTIRKIAHALQCSIYELME